MEAISSHAASRYYFLNLRCVNSSSSNLFKFPFVEKTKSFPVVNESVSSTSRYTHSNNSRFKRIHQYRPYRKVSCLKRYEHVTLSETCVLDGQESGTSVGQSIPKVSIPSLPDKENAENYVAPISSCFWEWKPKLNFHYETSGCENVGSSPVLFLPGFGVGSFHYEKQLKDLGRDYRVWALDFLGQGLSLPREDPTLRSMDENEYVLNGESNAWGFGDESETWANELVYSVDLWRDQVHYFVEEVIKEPVYIVGNSLGGFVALYFAANYPHLVKGVTLLNATPFWGFLPNPERSPRLSKLFPWAGTFPLPSRVRRLIEVLWQKIADPRSIAEILKQVYTDHSTDVDDVFSNIIKATRHPAAAASFASIMFAPRAKLSFSEALSICQTNNIPICLMYGREDPWITPIWGLQVKRQLPDAPYYELSPAGHCPHDEVPEVVNFLLRGWIKNLESDGSIVLPLLDELENVDYEITKDLEFTREGSKKSIRVQLHGTRFTFWKWLSSKYEAVLQEWTQSNT